MFWIVCIVTSLLLWAISMAHPQCIDGRPPFDAGAEYNFCPDYSHFGCCTNSDDDALGIWYNDLKNTVPSNRWATCSGYLKTFLCESCSPYASHIFDLKIDEVHEIFFSRLLPGLCQDYCKSFVDVCGDVFQLYADCMVQNNPELTNDAIILKDVFLNGSNSFCEAASLDDPGYCYPEVLEEKTSGIETLTSDGCLCVKKIGNKDLKDVLILTHANDDTNRIFVVEESGVGHIMYPDGSFHPEPFFNIKENAAHFTGTARKEPGALGLTFHPNFKENGLFYLYFTKYINETSGERLNSLAELKVFDSNKDKADPGYFRQILDVHQQSYAHHGGEIFFGADGYLYLSTGDGEPKNDPFRNSQSLDSLLGKILRIDVDNYTDDVPYSIPQDNPFLDPLEDGTLPRPEIYAYGFRNPWRCGVDSGDPETGAGRGRIICGDVGQSKIEELDLIEKGANYGWNNWEGSQRYCFKCKQGNAVIGGHFYRGCSLPNMDGAFVFGDFLTGRLFRLTETSPRVWEHNELIMCDTDLCHGPFTNTYGKHIVAFGQDQQGEIYILKSQNQVLNGSSSSIYKLIDPLSNNNCQLTSQQISNVKPKTFDNLNNISGEKIDVVPDDKLKSKYENDIKPASPTAPVKEKQAVEADSVIFNTLIGNAIHSGTRPKTETSTLTPAQNAKTNKQVAANSAGSEITNIEKSESSTVGESYKRDVITNRSVDSGINEPLQANGELKTTKEAGIRTESNTSTVTVTENIMETETTVTDSETFSSLMKFGFRFFLNGLPTELIDEVPGEMPLAGSTAKGTADEDENN